MTGHGSDVKTYELETDDYTEWLYENGMSLAKEFKELRDIPFISNYYDKEFKDFCKEQYDKERNND